MQARYFKMFPPRIFYIGLKTPLYAELKICMHVAFDLHEFTLPQCWGYRTGGNRIITTVSQKSNQRIIYTCVLPSNSQVRNLLFVCLFACLSVCLISWSSLRVSNMWNKNHTEITVKEKQPPGYMSTYSLT